MEFLLFSDSRPHVRHFYRPQCSCGKVMFLHVSVTLSTGGGCLSHNPLGRHRPLVGIHPRRADTPIGRQTPRLPPGRQTHLPPAGKSPRQNPPPPGTATAEDGTHPTGMHSCWDMCMTHISKLI